MIIEEFQQRGVKENMALKNISSIEVTNQGDGTKRIRLIDGEGDFIQGFDRFTEHLVNRGYAYATRERYSISAAKFIDYLYELGILGKTTTILKINQAIDFYPIFLRDGENVNALENTQLLRAFAKEIGLRQGISANSFDPTLAAVNLFLRVAQALADESSVEAKKLDASIRGDDFELVIRAISGSCSISAFEKKRLQQNSVLGSVMRLRGAIKRANRLKSPVRGQIQTDLHRLDFPLQEIPKLLEASTSFRDKALWSLLAASGIRLHEALNLRMHHIDPENGQVYVEDPNFVRFGRQMNGNEKIRFKGRATSRTFLFEPIKSEFFKYYELYLKREFVTTGKHDYFFQIIESTRRSAPLKDASDAALCKNFKKTVLRAGIPGPASQPERIWTIHSLRHMYGVYMLNYIPVPGGAGLRISEVQQLMGHKNVSSTQHYARHDEILLKAKIEAADAMIFDNGIDINDFPQLIGRRLAAEAKGYLQLGEASTNND